MSAVFLISLLVVIVLLLSIKLYRHSIRFKEIRRVVNEIAVIYGVGMFVQYEPGFTWLQH